VVWNYILNPQAHPVLLFSGVALVTAAIVVDALAYSAHARAKPEPGAKGRRSPVKGIVLSLAGGVLMGAFYPFVEMSKKGEIGLGPYSVGLVFAAAVLISTFLFNFYFMNLPVQGPPVSWRAYFQGTGRQHLLGVAGGVVWCIGTLSNFVASSAPREVNVGPAVSYALGQGATMISALWGLLVWKEFEGASSRVKVLLVLMFVLFVSGLGLVSVAPLVK
jgi:glucose uptake protein